ncbi:hypothetical protein JDS92_19390 [Bacillus cereus group sp. N12]|uniref:hypothetical protein n=1 Tax=Bacillus cereus group sp. N12 TaxID=2794586 RepID=UPI0018F57D72|nr:hypothetical protein [Bacillus cereus group sp. N12]MBJ8077508.1 hypothetical protein [Bacillus cereus group sp. N12]
MYSTALKHFKRYIEEYNDKDFQEELLKEELEFEKYLTDNPAYDQNGIFMDMYNLFLKYELKYPFAF